MSQHSEERLPEPAVAAAARGGARILPFERPQSDLQRAIQERAQEALDRDRERDRQKRRPQPLKWLALFTVASIPVLLTIGAVDGFLRAFHRMTAVYSSAPAPAQQTPETPVETAPEPSQPGVVILQPYDVPATAPQDHATPPPPETPSPR